MKNKAILILSIICISLLAFNSVDASNSINTSLFSAPERDSSFPNNSEVENGFAPQLVCPSSGGVILYRNANFDCAGLGEGIGYVLRSSTGWGNVPATFNDQASSLRVPSGWSVRLYERNDRGGASVCRNGDDDNFAGDYFDGGIVPLNDRVDSFEIFADTGCGAAPPAPALTSPPNGSSFETTSALSLDWETSAGAIEYYAHLWGGTDVDINSGWIADTDWLFGALEAGTYSWRAKARNTYGESAWSKTWNFIVTGPKVRVARVWTADGNWNPKTTFDPGDSIQWVIDVENLTGTQPTIDVTYDVQLDNGDTIAYWHGTLTTSPGTLSWGLPGTLPINRGGTHTFTGKVKYQGIETQATTEYFVTGTYVDLIFADGFESGNLLHWTSRKTNYGDLTVSFPSAMIGNKGMQALIDDNKLIYVTDATPYRESKYRARFYFDPNSITMKNLDNHCIFVGYDHEDDLIPVLRLELRRYNNTYQVRAGARNDNLSTWANSTWFTISDKPHYFELIWQSASSPGANNGVLRLLIDGVMRAKRGNIDNDTFHIDEINLGAVAGLDSGTRGTYYFDAFKSTHTKVIGPAMAETTDELGLQAENVITGPPVSR